jgi:hypothetical protein
MYINTKEKSVHNKILDKFIMEPVQISLENEVVCNIFLFFLNNSGYCCDIQKVNLLPHDIN